ncbi:colicin immunity protein [Pseudomonas aeruginosa]|nr:colicin immunity protein [Pseudomonas aeruginosa]
MSMALIDLARNFLDGSLSGKSFTKKFFEMWRSEGASGLLKKDDDNLGACLRLMFGMADCFTDGPKDNDCSGLLIPDTDLGENPRRERGV